MSNSYLSAQGEGMNKMAYKTWTISNESSLVVKKLRKTTSKSYTNKYICLSVCLYYVWERKKTGSLFEDSHLLQSRGSPQEKLHRVYQSSNPCTVG